MVGRTDGTILADIQKVNSLPLRHQPFEFFEPVEDDVYCKGFLGTNFFHLPLPILSTNRWGKNMTGIVQECYRLPQIIPSCCKAVTLESKAAARKNRPRLHLQLRKTITCWRGSCAKVSTHCSG